MPESVPPALSGLKVFYQHLLPQHLLSSLMYRLTRTTLVPFKDLLIRNFIRLYDVDMSQAREPDPAAYKHFNAFFTRELKSGARAVDTAMDAMVSPVDGAVSRFGKIDNGRLLQAKGRNYSLLSLLGGDQQLASRFIDGEFITLYLSPRDYHRIHMPLPGTLEKMTYVPGDLYSVSPATTQGIDNLFARNERVINLFNTPGGSMALVMVGAIFVGSMETVWAGEITPSGTRVLKMLDYNARNEHIQLDKGEELGRFNMGSTVILLLEAGSLRWNTTLAEDDTVWLGQKLATLVE